MREIDGKEIFGIEDVTYSEEPFCEHCYNLEPHTAVVDFDGIHYCLDCALNSSRDFVVSEEEKKEIAITEVNYQIEYAERNLRRLKEYREELLG